MITIVGGDLYQWDTGRKIQITSGYQWVDFRNFGCYQAKRVLVNATSNEVTIPNSTLTKAGTCTVYVGKTNNDGTTVTVVEEKIKIHGRAKPIGYRYDDDDFLNWEKLNDIVVSNAGTRVQQYEAAAKAEIEQAENRILNEIATAEGELEDYVTAASGYASAASSSASSASTSATNAETAKTAAETAKTGAETAASNLITNIQTNYPTYAQVASELASQKQELSNIVESGENIAGKNVETESGNIGTDGTETESSSYVRTVDYIAVEPSTRYTLVNWTNIALYNENKVFIKKLNRASSVTAEDGTKRGYLDTTSATRYIRLITNNSDSDHYCCNKGNTISEPDYNDFGTRIKTEALTALPAVALSGSVVDLVKSPYDRRADINLAKMAFEGWYKGKHTATNDIRRATNTTETYALFDALAEANPNYITVETLGLCSDGVQNVKRYTLKPYTVGLQYKKPKFLIFPAVHGWEKIGTAVMYYLIDDMCNHWQESPLLEYLRWNCEFVIIPVPNPYGYNRNERQNANGVNINRNYDTSAWPDYDDGGTAYDSKGTAPASEVETQYIQQTIQDNMDAVAVIDYHTNSGSTTAYYQMLAVVSCIMNANDDYQKTLTKSGEFIGSQIQHRINADYGLSVPIKSKCWDVRSNTELSVTCKDYCAEQNILGCTYEGFAGDDNGFLGDDMHRFSPANIKFNAEMFANFLGSILNQLG